MEMPINTRYKNLSEAFHLSAVHLNHAPLISPRGMSTKELLAYSFSITSPEEVFLFSKHRTVNPFAQIAETLWSFAGRDDLDWLERYIPGCKQWSDNGSTWRAAYGPRLRSWPGTHGEVDQIANVEHHLAHKIDSRQAIMSIWDPGRDWVESKDIPCNNWLQFIVRDGKLNLFVSVRSNDLVFGFSHADFFQWSLLLHMMAWWIDAEVGFIHWFAGSFHVYERHFSMMQKIDEDWLPELSHYKGQKIHPFVSDFQTPFEMFDESLSYFFIYEERAWELDVTDMSPEDYVGTLHDFINAGKEILYSEYDDFFLQCTLAMWVHRWWQGTKDLDSTYRVLHLMMSTESDLYHAIIQYLYKDHITKTTARSHGLELADFINSGVSL